MPDDLIYFVYVPLAALVVAAITLGGATLAYFSEERWGGRSAQETGEHRDPAADVVGR